MNIDMQAIIQPVTRDEAILWAWANGKAGTPPDTFKDEDGRTRGILRGAGWRLIFPADGDEQGEILLVTSGLVTVPADSPEEPS